MKKKLSSIDIMGIIGILIWVVVILLRGSYVTSNSMYHFVIGILPNFGAAWFTTALIYTFIQTNKPYTIKIHQIVCLIIIILAVISEVLHDQFFGASFDIYDLIATMIAQLIMMYVPLLTKDNALVDFKAEENSNDN